MSRELVACAHPRWVSAAVSRVANRRHTRDDTEAPAALLAIATAGEFSLFFARRTLSIRAASHAMGCTFVRDVPIGVVVVVTTKSVECVPGVDFAAVSISGLTTTGWTREGAVVVAGFARDTGTAAATGSGRCFLRVGSVDRGTRNLLAGSRAGFLCDDIGGRLVLTPFAAATARVPGAGLFDRVTSRDRGCDAVGVASCFLRPFGNGVVDWDCGRDFNKCGACCPGPVTGVGVERGRVAMLTVVRSRSAGCEVVVRAGGVDCDLGNGQTSGRICMGGSSGARGLDCGGGRGGGES